MIIYQIISTFIILNLKIKLLQQKDSLNKPSFFNLSIAKTTTKSSISIVNQLNQASFSILLEQQITWDYFLIHSRTAWQNYLHHNQLKWLTQFWCMNDSSGGQRFFELLKGLDTVRCEIKQHILGQQKSQKASQYNDSILLCYYLNMTHRFTIRDRIDDTIVKALQNVHHIASFIKLC